MAAKKKSVNPKSQNNKPEASAFDSFMNGFQNEWERQKENDGEVFANFTHGIEAGMENAKESKGQREVKLNLEAESDGADAKNEVKTEAKKETSSAVQEVQK